MRREDLLLAAETAREQAELYEMMGKNREMLQALSLSHTLFTKLRAQHNSPTCERRIGRLERRFYDVVTNWAQTIESKDAYTLGHCERVADYACALARDIGFDEITMFWFRIGALLHDVGKIVVPSEILNKPGRFTRRGARDHGAARGRPAATSCATSTFRGTSCRWCAATTSGGTARGYPDRLAGDGHRAQRAHRLRRRRLRRVDDGSSLPAGVHARPGVDDDGGRQRQDVRPRALRALRAGDADDDHSSPSGAAHRRSLPRARPPLTLDVRPGRESVFSSTTFSWRMPAGSLRNAISPSALPSSARPIGDAMVTWPSSSSSAVAEDERVGLPRLGLLVLRPRPRAEAHAVGRESAAGSIEAILLNRS